MELVSARGDANDASLFFADLSSQEAISIACECIEKVSPKEVKTFWQVLVLRTATSEEQATSRVLNGDEIQLLLDTTPDSHTDSDGDKTK